MKISPKQNIYFLKKLIAKCDIKDNKSNTPCSFYQLEDEDRDYFIKLVHKKGWRDYLYAMLIDGDMRRKNVDKIYVLEDEKSDCLGYMKVDTNFEDANSIEFIEVKPDCRANKSWGQKRYIGETMLNFLAQLTKLTEKSFLSVPYPDRDAVGFYKKCYFTPKGQGRACMLTEDNMDKLKEQNYTHTGSKIEFVD